MKGVVLAAGKGTRLKPLTLAIPKELIRVGTKPVIEHVIDVLKEGGIKDILVVTGWKKGAILDFLGSGKRLGVEIYYKVQEELKGTAHALYQAKDWVKEEDFAMSYGDNYFKPKKIMQDVIRFHEEKEAYATLVLHPVKDPRRFGIVKIAKSGEIKGMIEKPSLREARPYKVGNYYYNIAGLMVLNPKIFEYIKKTKSGKDNEIWLTDSVELMRRDAHPVYGYIFKGLRYDIGTFESLKLADEQEYRR
jgi:dTDP-glucose pyrophosphorylase